MFSRENRRRNRERLLQAAGIHQVTKDDEAFVAKLEASKNLEKRLDDARRCVYEYSLALHALSDKSASLATALAALSDDAHGDADACTHTRADAGARGGAGLRADQEAPRAPHVRRADRRRVRGVEKEGHRGLGLSTISFKSPRPEQRLGVLVGADHDGAGRRDLQQARPRTSKQ